MLIQLSAAETPAQAIAAARVKGGQTTTKTSGGGTKIGCHAFDFDFAHANVHGNVVINIPKVGEVFCGEAGNVSGHSHYTNISKTQALAGGKGVTSFQAVKGPNGTMTLKPIIVLKSSAVWKAYVNWLSAHPNPTIILI